MIPASALQFAERYTGPAAEVCRAPGTGHGGRSWRIIGAHSVAYLKVCASSGGARREAEANHRVDARLPVQTPRVLARENRWLLLSECVGNPAATLPESALPTIARSLAALHMPLNPNIGEDWPPARSFAARAGAARPAVTVCDTAIAETLFQQATSDFDDGHQPGRVFCHRDCGPWNWLHVRGDVVALIDFEHARADWAVFDVLHLWEAGALSTESGKSVFIRHYGSAPWTSSMWRPAQALFVLQTLAWSARHPSDERILRRAQALTESWQREQVLRTSEQHFT
ncbi:MAG: hypothetical protein ACI81R_000559 [Bradymonadia bacterium]